MSLNFLRLILLSLLILLLAPISELKAAEGLAVCISSCTFSPTEANGEGEVHSIFTDNYNTEFNFSCSHTATLSVDIDNGDGTGLKQWIMTNVDNGASCPAGGGGQVRYEFCNNETFDYPLCTDTTPPSNNCQSTSGQIIRDLIGAAPVPVVCDSGCQYVNNQPAGGMTVTSTSAFTSSSTVTYVGNGVECDNSEGTNTPGTNPDVTDTDNDGIPEVNGEELPETPPPSDGCVLLPDGSLYCGSSSSSPPAPDDGTPGQPATPDQMVTNTTTNTTNNYYDDTTTGNSSGGTPDGQVDGVCDPSVETCGTDQGSAEDNGCGALPTCTGDAIQCVILKMQHDTRCNLQTEIDDVTETDVMSQIGVTETIEDWKAANDADPDNTIDVDTEFFSDTPGTAACPADFSINVPFMATPVTIPNQPICDFLNFIRPAVIALSYLVSGLMIFAAFREGI